MQNKGQNTFISFTRTNCTQAKETFKVLFSLKLRAFKLREKGHSGPESALAGFFLVPLQFFFVGPDVLCRYLFSLWTGQQKAAGIMMERQNHSDIVAGPYKR